MSIKGDDTVSLGDGEDMETDAETENPNNAAVDTGQEVTEENETDGINETQDISDSEQHTHPVDKDDGLKKREDASLSNRSSVVPLSLTVAKESLHLNDSCESVVAEAGSSEPQSTHIEIHLQENSTQSHGTEMQSTSETGVPGTRVINLEVSCSGDNQGPESDKTNVYTVLYSCNKCSFCTSNLSELKLHAHTEQHEIETEKEGVSSSKESGEAVKIQYACTDCAFKSKRFLTYREHLLTHAKIGAKEMFKCMDCDYTTRLKYNLKTHLKRHAKIGELCEDELFRCTKCDYVSPYKHDLMTHTKKHEAEKPFQCKQCDFQSIYKHSLIHHVRSKHERLRPFKCDQCDYSSARKQDLQTHMGRHAEEKRFKCDRCNYATPYRVSFKAHMDRHMGNKLFKCEQEGCDFATTTKQNLKSHELRHSTVKPLQCPFCEYTTAHKQQMVNHEQKHADTARPPNNNTYSCPSCDYTTLHRYSLQRHLNRHKTDRKKPEKDFVCEECGYSTGYKNSLKRHMAQHSDVKPFKCGHCDYSAINMTQMHVHIAKHTGIKPYKCEVCDYATANNQHLVGHMAKHSKVRLNCSKCNFSTAWKQRLRAHLKAHETGQLFQNKVMTRAGVQQGKILYTLPGSSQDQGNEAAMIAERNDAINEISNAIEAFHSYSLQVEVASNQDQGNGNPGDQGKDSSSQKGDRTDGEFQRRVEQVQLVDEDGNRVAAALQCMNGEQSIEVALKDFQKDGTQVFVWKQTAVAADSQQIGTVSPQQSSAESENDVELLVIDEMKAV